MAKAVAKAGDLDRAVTIANANPDPYSQALVLLRVGIPLWADDTGLRAAAHQLGIKTFSTHALLTLAAEHQRIDPTTAGESIRALICERTVDLPYDHQLLAEIAAEENWEPRSVATVLSRNTTCTTAGNP